MNSPAGTSTGNNYHHDLLNSWTPENSGSNIPRFAYNDSNQAAVSDRFLTSASYLNIQNITLGYTLPKRITRKFLVENLRIYEPVLLRPDSHLLGRCNRNVLIC